MLKSLLLHSTVGGRCAAGFKTKDPGANARCGEAAQIVSSLNGPTKEAAEKLALRVAHSSFA